MIETNVCSVLWKASWEGVSLNSRGCGSVPFQIPGARSMNTLTFRYLANLALFIRASFKEEIESMPVMVETLSDMLISALFHFPDIRFQSAAPRFPTPFSGQSPGKPNSWRDKVFGFWYHLPARLLCSVTAVRLVCFSSSKRNSDTLHHNLYN